MHKILEMIVWKEFTYIGSRWCKMVGVSQTLLLYGLK